MFRFSFAGDVPRAGDLQRGQQQRRRARALLPPLQPSAGPELFHLHPGGRQWDRVRG